MGLDRLSGPAPGGRGVGLRHGRRQPHRGGQPSLTKLNAIRYDPSGDGTVYAFAPQRFHDAFSEAFGAFPNALASMDCPDACKGYELTADLDFDTNGDGRTDVAGDDYWNGGAGWEPIPRPDFAYNYGGEFHGNGHTISNLYINRRTARSGCSTVLTICSSHGAAQRQRDEHSSFPSNSTGALVGDSGGNLPGARVSAVYATGSVSGRGKVGGLVGGNIAGQVIASCTDVVVTGGSDTGGVSASTRTAPKTPAPFPGRCTASMPEGRSRRPAATSARGRRQPAGRRHPLELFRRRQHRAGRRQPRQDHRRAADLRGLRRHLRRLERGPGRRRRRRQRGRPLGLRHK